MKGEKRGGREKQARPLTPLSSATHFKPGFVIVKCPLAEDYR